MANTSLNKEWRAVLCHNIFRHRREAGDGVGPRIICDLRESKWGKEMEMPLYLFAALFSLLSPSYATKRGPAICNFAVLFFSSICSCSISILVNLATAYFPNFPLSSFSF